MLQPRARLIVIPLPGARETARLSPDEAAHSRARRLRAGDPVVLLDGSGRQARARLTRLDAKGGEVAVEEIVEAEASGPAVTVVVAGLRAERLAWLAEKATELSAARVTIVASARTQSFRAAAGAVARLQRVVREAAKQCEAARWPEIAGPVPLERALVEDAASHRFLLDRGADPLPRTLAPRPAALLVGPEGGWTDAEREAARARGWTAAALPAGKLRAETAAIAALVLLRAALEAGKRG